MRPQAFLGYLKLMYRHQLALDAPRVFAKNLQPNALMNSLVD